MRFDLLKPVYQEEEGGEGGTGGTGGPTIEELQTALDAAQKSVTALENKQVELLDEAKKAKAARKAVEEAARLDAENKAKGQGDFEQLYKSSEAARLALQEEHVALKGNVANEKRNNEAMKIATSLADGPNAELLSEQIAKRLKFTDEGLKVTDASGNLTVSSLKDLATEFQNNDRYKALLKGNQSSGGGASGGSNSGGAAKTMTRAEFNTLDPVAQSKAMKDGMKLTDT
jgi:hypothetical protein